MSELLFELFSEEIPARLQRPAARDLQRILETGLKAAGLECSSLEAHVTPRRLVLMVEGLPESQPDTVTERKGPRVGAPEKAMQGFLASTGLSLEECEKRELPKGEFYFAVIRNIGRPTKEVLVGLLDECIAKLPWPKSMRWGSGDTRWVRPLHSILAIFDGEVLPVEFGGVQAGNQTRGHRFLAGKSFGVDSIADYRRQLAAADVVLSSEERRSIIDRDAAALASAEGLQVKADPQLSEECAGLVECPQVLLGSIDEEFMRVPGEILSNAMRAHQKYFSLLDGDGRLAPKFIVVSNMRAKDGGAQIVAGNERVLRARLSDAQFFWDTDLKTSLESRLPKLEKIVFQAKFGEGASLLSDKVQRIESLSRFIGESIDADGDACARAARLCKADLVSDVVYEFPELQGLMGRYYAEHAKEDAAVSQAIEEHYAPAGAGDSCPTAVVSCAVSLADKIDSLVGFFAIDEKPTGSKDPFALRRAALGVLRIVLENRLRLGLRALIASSLDTYPADVGEGQQEQLAETLLGFFADRLKVHLKDQGVAHDHITAVFSAEADDDFERLILKVRALGEFLSTEDGTNLLAAYRRASNIVRIEEKRDDTRFTGDIDGGLLELEPERSLVQELGSARSAIAAALETEDFGAAMASLAGLRQPVDRFFDDVIVNADRPELRVNRLRILAGIRAALGTIADFSKIEG